MTDNEFIYFKTRTILNLVLLDYLDSPEVDAYRLDVLNKLKEDLLT